jgi:hypothetical protein
MLSPNTMPGRRVPWNKGKLVGQKAPLKLKDIWAIRVRLELGDRRRRSIRNYRAHLKVGAGLDPPHSAAALGKPNLDFRFAKRRARIR